MNYYNIAGLKININGINNDYFDYRLSDYVAINDASEFCDIEINHQDNCKDIILPSGKIIANINQRYWMELTNGGFATFDNIPEITQNLKLVVTDNSWSNINTKLCNPELLYLEEDNRPFFMIGEIFKFAILKHNGIVIHLSAIEYDGGGILFSAPSGTGKSTHTGLWKKHYPNNTTILNDDAPAVRFIDDIPYIFGTPWSGKTEINCNRTAPLKAIIFLQQAEKNSIHKIEGNEAIWRLLNETRQPALKEMMNMTLDMLEKTLRKVPTYLLSCNMSQEAVEVAKSIL